MNEFIGYILDAPMAFFYVIEEAYDEFGLSPSAIIVYTIFPIIFIPMYLLSYLVDRKTVTLIITKKDG
jgi:hypothetical protein